MYHDTVTPGRTVHWHSMLRFTVTLVLRVTLFESPFLSENDIENLLLQSRADFSR